MYEIWVFKCMTLVWSERTFAIANQDLGPVQNSSGDSLLTTRLVFEYEVLKETE